MARRNRRGFTLVEMLVVVTILGIMSGLGIAILSPQISYYRARTSAESVASLLRTAQYFARTTNIGTADDRFGPISDTAPHSFWGTRNPVPVYGVSIFRGSAAGPPYRLYFWRHRDPEHRQFDMPGRGASFLTLDTPAERAETILLPADTVLSRDARLDLNGGVPLADTQLAFRPDGRLDTDESDEENLTMNDRFGNGEYRTYSFDAWNPAVGYIRIRINTDGSIEQSAHMPTFRDPVTKGGSPF